MRCFLGINLDDYSKKLDKINLPKEPEMSKVKEYHITLIFYKDLPDNDIEKFKEKLKNFSFPKFDLEGDKLVAFPNKGAPDLYALGFKDDLKLRKLYEKIGNLIKIESDKKFNPHITLLRKEELPPDFKKSKENYSDVNSVKLEIDCFGLYKSEPSKGITSYTPLFIIKLK